jgi:hypothetical protein
MNDVNEYNGRHNKKVIFTLLHSSSSASGHTRVPISKDEFERCWSNRLCLKCKKPGHIARECRTMSNVAAPHLKH